MLVGFDDDGYVRGKMTNLIYKVCTRSEWTDARQTGTYAGSKDDLHDGFIHFSTAEQLPTTLAKHFTGQEDLVLIAVQATSLGNNLKWEKSRGGKLFPHLYGPLAISDASAPQNLPLGPDGHILPELETN